MSRFEATPTLEESMLVIHLSGTLDRDAEPALTEAYGAADENGCRTVALSFDDVDFINSTGIALIIALLAQARSDARAVVAWGLTDHYREVFEITRLSDFVEIFANEQAARAACDTSPTGSGND